MQFLEQWSDIPTGHGLRAKFHLHNWRRGHQSIYQKFSWILGSQLFQLMMQSLNKFSFFSNVFLFAKKDNQNAKKSILTIVPVDDPKLE